ncbi:MAG: DUF4405 domain-containing protein [Anaerolineae bacterium]|nr:DUF4405 domain-containing protein [Anaerolineae bacterium]
MTKTGLNYWLDVVIGIAFIASLVTGVAFLFKGTGGYEGGRNPAYDVAFLGVAREVWRPLHTFTSFVMTAGVGLHLVFHFRWITCVTKRMLPVRELRVSVQTQDAVFEVTS